MIKEKFRSFAPKPRQLYAQEKTLHYLDGNYRNYRLGFAD
jgi:hypothetical protein